MDFIISDLAFNSALVTGGAGFIGSHLVAALVADGCRVTVLDNLCVGHRENIADFENDITFIEGDIRDSDSLAQAVAGCDVVFHLAAVVSVPRTIADPLESAAVNDIGTLKVLEAARQKKVKRVVFSSSCAVYGNSARVPNREDMPTRPMSPYAVHKVCGENHASVYSELYGLETVSLRCFNVYGPRLDPSSPYSGVISIFLDRAGRGEPPVIFGDGGQSRDFVFVDDVVAANMLAARQNEVSGKVFNIGTGRKTTINALWKEIHGRTDTRLVPEYKPARDGDIYTSVADITLAKAKLGFETQTTLEEGLAETYRWYVQGG